MVGEGGHYGAAGAGGGEDDDTAALRSLEKVLTRQSARQRRRPSKEVRCVYSSRDGKTIPTTHNEPTTSSLSN